MWNKIVNPKTGRKVNVNSKIGKNVLRNYINQLGGKPVKRGGGPGPLLLADLFRLANNQWRCKTCLVRNDKPPPGTDAWCITGCGQKYSENNDN